MANKCTGGFLDGMDVYTREDAQQCVNGGGQVVKTGDSAGCGMSSAMASQAGDEGAFSGGVASLALAPFRRVRDEFRGHPFVDELLNLNARAAPEIERIAGLDVELRKELVATVITLGHLAAALFDDRAADIVYDDKLHARLTDLADRFVAETKDRALRRSIEATLGRAKDFVGKSLKDISDELNRRAGTTEDAPAGAQELVKIYPAAAVGVAEPYPYASRRILDGIWREPPPFVDLAELKKAEAAITAKAGQLGWLGNPVHHVEHVPGGYRRSYENADVYFSTTTGAHEVHGDIRAKYNALGGPAGVLGLPETDETGTPDGIGRFNHFQHGGSIYWTPSTGPMMVRGVIRGLWANGGWETGSMGYPVRDEIRLSGLYPTDHPDIAWSFFENGALFSKGNAVAEGVWAEIAPDTLKSVIRTFFDRKLHAANGDLGLEAQVDRIAVSGWGYGFWGSMHRTITYRLYGFHDNGLAPDTTFQIEIRLRFGTATSPSFTYPAFVSLIVALDWLKVTASGLGSGQLANGIFQGIQDAFYTADPSHPEVPSGALYLADFPTGANQTGTGSIDVLGILTTFDGGLRVLLNPLPPSFGALRKLVAQNQVDAFIQSF